MKMFLATGAALLASLTASAAVAQDGDRSFVLPAAPEWQSADGETAIRLRGRVFHDWADVDWSSPNSSAPTDRQEFRTARLGFEVEHGPAKLVVEYDFAGDNAQPNDVVVSVNLPRGRVRIGHFKTMNSLEEQTSSRYITFMERGLSTDLFGLDRRIGAAWDWSAQGFTASVGVFGGRMDDNFAFREADDSQALAARLTWSGEINATRWHLGASWRGLEHDGGTRVRAYPQAHLSRRFSAADYRTGAALGKADRSDYFGLETAAVRRTFHVHAELAHLALDGPVGDPGFTSGMIQAGWLLTGETRPYKASSGTFGRIVPTRSVGAGGWGAFEIAARHDISDLGDAQLGRIHATTLGANWYLQDHLRVMANLVTARMNASGFTERSDAIQFRVQADF